jgi:hypothetical protein
MATQYGFGQTVTSGLLLSLDAADLNSYPGSGTVWNDLTGNNNNALFISGAVYTNTNGGVVTFDGTNDYASSSLSVNSITNVTLQCWVNITTTSKKGAFIKVGGGANGYAIGVGLNDYENLGNEIIGLFPGIRWIDTNVTYGTGWKMSTLVIGATSIPTIYVNDTLIGSYSGTAPLTPTANVYFGRNVGDEGAILRAFGGDMANAKIYNRVLSATEITQNYNEQKSRFGL